MSLSEKLNKELVNHIDKVMADHYPNAKKSGNTYQMGDFDGNDGKSCGVFVGRGGIYLATDKGETKNLIGLLCDHRFGGDWLAALDYAKKTCGYREVSPCAPSKPKPKPKPMVRQSMRDTPVLRYANQRGIKEAALMHYEVRRVERKDLPPTDRERWNQDYLHFRYVDTNGDLVKMKWIGIERRTTESGKEEKEVGTTYPDYSTLWGWWTVLPSMRDVLLCEGEIDTLSVWQMLRDEGLDGRYAVLGLPNGTGTTWINNDWERLELFENVYILTDNDEGHPGGRNPGEELAKNIADRLGLSRCYRVGWPVGINDANEYLLSKEYGKKKLSELIAESKTYDPPAMLSVGDLAEKAAGRTAEMAQLLKARDFIFPSLDFKFLPKDTGILTGGIGHGKTDFATNMILSEIRNGQIALIVALDTPPEDLMVICAHIMLGHPPSALDVERCARELEGKLYFVDGVEFPITTQSCLDNMEYAVRRFGVTRIQIDNLSEIADLRKDDYDGQGKFVRKLDKFDKKYATNTLLVAHANSREGCDWHIPGRNDVEGDKGMVKPIQYGISIFRNKVKEKPEEYEDGDRTPKRIVRLLDGSAAYLSIWKQRNGFREEFIQPLEYDKKSRWFRLPYEQFKSPYPMSPSGQMEIEDKGTVEPRNEAFADAYAENPF